MMEWPSVRVFEVEDEKIFLCLALIDIETLNIVANERVRQIALIEAVAYPSLPLVLHDLESMSMPQRRDYMTMVHHGERYVAQALKGDEPEGEETK